MLCIIMPYGYSEAAVYFPGQAGAGAGAGVTGGVTPTRDLFYTTNVG